jgi:hypothetical protein
MRKSYRKAIGFHSTWAAVRTIEVDHRDLDSVDAAKEELIRQMQSMQGKERIDSPISVAVDLELLRESGNPEQRQLADVLTGVSELKAVIEKKLSDPAALIPPGYMRDMLSPLIEMQMERMVFERDRGLSFHTLEELMYNVRLLSKTVGTGSPGQAELVDRIEKICRHAAHDSGMSPRMFMTDPGHRKLNEKS